MEYGSRPRSIQERHQLTYRLKFKVFQTIQPKLTIEIIRILILLSLSRERDEAPIVVEALGSGPVGPRFKTSLFIEEHFFHDVWNLNSNTMVF
ncbi:hypothetical protein TNCV_3535111 [Trichonephila clavipes]|nr:hypothetical protein TNCV_3535111 [Trichonephila clavipes]